jgi:hypothetical protein
MVCVGDGGTESCYMKLNDVDAGPEGAKKHESICEDASSKWTIVDLDVPGR